MVGLKEYLPRAFQKIEAKKRASENDKLVEDSAALQEESKNKALARCEQARKLLAERQKARAETRRSRPRERSRHGVDVENALLARRGAVSTAGAIVESGARARRAFT